MFKTRILLAEDDNDTRYALALLLQMEGYEVTTAADGEEAFVAAVTGSPDLIVTDINMPRASGLDLIRMIQAEPCTETIPIIAMSAVESHFLSSAMDLGAVAALQKPFEFDQLLSLVAKIVTARRARRQRQSPITARHSRRIESGPVSM